MPRSSGIFTLIASYFATPGQTIRTEQHNPVLEDIASALTASVARDGTSPMLGNLPMNGRRITGLGAGVNDDDAVRLDQVPVASVLTPPGMVAMFATASAPAGWLIANGTAVSRTTYAALWVALGSPNTGNGTTTFTLPDYRGEFLRGLDLGRGVDTGRTLGSAQAAAMLNHTHSGSTSAAGGHTHAFDGTSGSNFNSGQTVGFTMDATGGATNFGTKNTGDISAVGDHTHTMTTGNPSVGGGTETRPRNIALLACIKT